MQSLDMVDLLAWALIIMGCIIILSGIGSMLMRSDIDGVEQRRENKGIILLGPIPIVWGYGRKPWIIAAIVALVLFLIVFIGIP
ncbi:MAG: DUF131 domain-containing protein [Candidatus Thorarchaeota archaeon]|nr:DUF131 domain-containing protein [Candidatus Thorarchaeota archaeon]